jgi:hypothetical protein
MPPCVLYQRLLLQFAACAPSLHVWSRRRLALVVTGLLLARHAALPRMAAQLRRVVGTAHTDSIERRLRRTLAETDFETSQVFDQLARTALRKLAPGRYLLLLDDTQQTTRCTLSTLALDYGGRALPLAWCRWSGKLHGTYWRQIDALFDQAERLLPPHLHPVVVADRGVASPTLIRLIQKHHWDYVVRVNRNVTLRLPQQPRQVLALGGLLDRACGVTVRLTGWVFQDAPIWAHALVVWRPRHDEPWILVSSLDLGRQLADLYAHRMHVEALFRDTKSGAFEWELSRVVQPDRAMRLLLGIMLAIWCAVLLGEAAIRAGEIPAYGRRQHAVSLLRRGLDWLAAPPRSRCFRWTLAPAETVRI